MESPPIWVLIPAAGSGRRMGSQRPKQYLPLVDRSVIEHTLQPLLAHPHIDGVAVVLSPGDPYWHDLGLSHPKLVAMEVGGDERCDSVLNGLEQLSQRLDGQSWILVHDAARPCIHPSDIDALLEQLKDHPVGGLLGQPVNDTLKRVNNSAVVEQTVDRAQLWRAYTPQMFRLGDLKRSLNQARQQGLMVTDDASAMELMGLSPQMVVGRGDNIKVTHPEDLGLAEIYLIKQGRANSTLEQDDG